MAKTTKDTIKVQISLPKDIHEKYKSLADRTGVTLSSLIVLDLVTKASERVMLDSLPEMLRQLQSIPGAPKDNSTEK